MSITYFHIDSVIFSKTVMLNVSMTVNNIRRCNSSQYIFELKDCFGEIFISLTLTQTIPNKLWASFSTVLLSNFTGNIHV